MLSVLSRHESQMVLIGDTLHDAEVVAATHVDCVLVAHGHQSKERLKQRGAQVVDSLEAIVRT